MTTKTHPASTANIVCGQRADNGRPISYSGNTGIRTITYGDGPIHIGGHVNWKRCSQTSINQRRATGGWTWVAKGYGRQTGWINWTSKLGVTGNYALPATSDLASECWTNLMDQIDLNCEDAVLLYSGVLQAVPLVGGALNFVSVFNRAARNLSKSFRRQPFTTVVKSLISLDFIDRFVVSPTIDDARKFMDATNYVLRVLDTARRRNMVPVRYESKATTVSVRSLSSNQRVSIPVSNSDIYGTKYMYYDSYNRKGTEMNMYLLAEVSYDTAAIDPIKLWAARVGLTRPLDSVWDLVPFSFVIDYFTRAGDFISGLSNEMSSQDGLRGKVQTFRDAWVTVKTKNEDEWKFTSRGSLRLIGGQVTQDEFSPFSVFRGSTSFQRYPINPWIWADPSQGFFRWDLSSTRYRTLLELWMQSKLR